MSYQVLARKWRPQTYAEVVGQQHVLAALASSCAQDRLHHAYLFSGSRGVGKTTLARLFAKGLNCSTGITAIPCGECSACRDIEQGRFIDLLEIDAASRTKVEDTRELLDNIQYLPAHGRFKIYLIDEVHMLSRHSFNALLKTLEEPPAHVKFLLATTDPQKLPVTVLSRCLQFHLQLLSIEKIQAQLQKILQLEAITAEPRALLLLARAARGSLRDALSLTDQAIAIGQGEITTTVVSQMLGTLDDQLALALVEALQRADAVALMQIVEQVFVQGDNGEQLLSDMAAILHQIAMRQWLPGLLPDMEDEQQLGAVRIQALARLITPQDLQIYYQTLLIGRKELPLAPDQRMGVEMTLLRALAFHPKAEAPSPRVQSTGVPAPLTTSTSPPALAAETHGAQPAALSVVGLQQSKPTVMAEEAQLAPEVVSVPLMAAPLTVRMPSPAVETHEAQPTPLLAVNPLQSVPTTAAEEAQSVETTQLLHVRQQLRQQQRQVRQARAQGHSATTTMTTPTTRLPTQTVTSVTRPVIQHVPMANQPSVASTPQLSAKQSSTDERLVLAAQLAEQAALRDNWSAEVARLTLPKSVEQLALNSVRELQAPGQIILHLRKAQRHLNGPTAQAALVKALSAAAGHPVAVTILEQDDRGQADPAQRTPLEWRQAIYQEQLAVARQAVLTDENIQRLQRDFAAQLDEESIQPL